MISSAVGSAALALVSVESVSPDPLRLLGAGGDLGCLDCVRVVSVVISTLGHLVRAGALAINTRPGAWNMSHYYQWSTKLDHVTSQGNAATLERQPALR